jgi:hypothetical protein
MAGSDYCRRNIPDRVCNYWGVACLGGKASGSVKGRWYGLAAWNRTKIDTLPYVRLRLLIEATKMYIL